MSTNPYKQFGTNEFGNEGKLDLAQLDIAVDVDTISQYPNDVYALLRKHGLGASDSSIVVGVNPYTTKAELVAEKSRDFLTDEERAVGDKSAVVKGRDLEPLIIQKHSEMIGKKVIKPEDMFRSNEHPWLKINFDGVIDKEILKDGRYQYIPDEIKVCTMYGEKHYDKTKAYLRQTVGLLGIPEDYSKTNNSSETKAALYGIPPYYYTQLHQQIYGLNAPYGYLTVLFEKTWEICSFLVWRDDAVINQIIVEGWKVWQHITVKTGDPDWDSMEKYLPILMDKVAAMPKQPTITYLEDDNVEKHQTLESQG